VVAIPGVKKAVQLEERVANVSARRPRRQVGHSAVLTVLRERSRCCFTDSLARAGKEPSGTVKVRSREVNSLCTIVGDAVARISAMVGNAGASVGAYGRQGEGEGEGEYCGKCYLFHM